MQTLASGRLGVPCVLLSVPLKSPTRKTGTRSFSAARLPGGQAVRTAGVRDISGGPIRCLGELVPLATTPRERA